MWSKSQERESRRIVSVVDTIRTLLDTIQRIGDIQIIQVSTIAAGRENFPSTGCSVIDAPFLQTEQYHESLPGRTAPELRIPGSHGKIVCDGRIGHSPGICPRSVRAGQVCVASAGSG